MDDRKDHPKPPIDIPFSQPSPERSQPPPEKTQPTPIKTTPAPQKSPSQPPPK